MAAEISRRVALVVLVSLTSILVPLGHAQEASPAATLASNAQELENQKRWLEAAQVYAQLLASEPDNTAWQEGFRRCLTQNRISQRYRDGSVRQILHRWQLTQALRAYEEFVQLAEQVFLQNVSAEYLWRRGCEQCLWALTNPAYLAVAFKEAPSAGQVEKLRHMLQTALHQPVPDSFHLVAFVQSLAERARLYAPIRPVALVWEFLAAGCEALDAYGAYVSPTAWALEKVLAEGRWVGVGLEVAATQDGMVVSSVAPQSEAKQLGIVPGSKVLKIDGETVRDVTQEEALLRLLGPAETTVTLEIAAPTGEVRQLVLTRRRYTPVSISQSAMLDSMYGIGYIRLSGFYPGTAQELEQALRKLTREGLQVLILDLRGNPGGSVRAALEVADLFIPEGTLLITQGRLPQLNQQYPARAGGDWQVPVLVMVDEETASAAEMVAAALQTHAQAGHLVALVVGQPTRGKSALQQLVPLADGLAGAVYLTTARWLTPSGVCVAGQGIQPDVLIKKTVATEPTHEMMEPMANPDMVSGNSLAWQVALRQVIQLFCEQP